MNAPKVILVLVIIGFVLSGYLTYLHFSPEKFDSSFCNLSHFLSCSTVNKSSYATFLGIPVALLGMGWFFLLAILAFEHIPHHRVALFYASIIGVGFMVYLTAAEIFIIRAICVICVVIAVISLIIFIITLSSFREESIKFVREIQFE